MSEIDQSIGISVTKKMRLTAGLLDFLNRNMYAVAMAFMGLLLLLILLYLLADRKKRKDEEKRR